MSTSVPTSWTRRLTGGATLLLGLGLTWGWLSGPGAYVKNWLFPQDFEIFVVDQRASGDFSIDLEHLYSSLSQRRDGLRVVVRRVERDEIARATELLFSKFEAARNAGDASKLFIELAAPYPCSQKMLRRAIDEQTRFTGLLRVALLERTVAIIGTQVGPTQYSCNGVEGTIRAKPDACQRLFEDWAYMKWNFGGIGLAIDEQTLSMVGKCLPSLIAAINRT